MAAFDLLDTATFAAGHPHAAYDALRAAHPVYRHPGSDKQPPFWVLTRYDDAGVRSNGYFIADALGAYNPTGAYLGLSDAAFAGANTTGGLTAEFSEVA